MERPAFISTGEIHETHELAEACITFSAEWGIAYQPAMAMVLRGWSLAEQRQLEDGIDQMHQGLAAMQRVGNEVSRPSFLALLAEVYGKNGRVEEGLALLSEVRSLVDTNGQRYQEAEFRRLQGELLLRQGTPDAAQAENCFQQALDIARHQGTKSWELKAATSLAKLWQSQGKRQDAYDLLAPVYGWFTEGLDTADLQDAKALLGQLAP